MASWVPRGVASVGEHSRAHPDPSPMTPGTSSAPWPPHTFSLLMTVTKMFAESGVYRAHPYLIQTRTRGPCRALWPGELQDRGALSACPYHSALEGSTRVRSCMTRDTLCVAVFSQRARGALCWRASALRSRFLPTRWLLRRFILPKPGQGPSEETRETGFCAHLRLRPWRKGVNADSCGEVAIQVM